MALAGLVPLSSPARDPGSLADAVAAFHEAAQAWDGAALQEASDRFAAFCVEHPDSAPARYWHAAALFHRCLYFRRAERRTDRDLLPEALETAEQNLKEAIERDPDNGELHAILATVIGMRIAEHPLTAVWRGRIVDRHKKAALARAPDNPRVQYLLGSSFLHAPALLGGREKGLPYLLKAETLFKKEHAAPPEATAPRWGYCSCLFFIAQILEEQGKTEESIAYLVKTLNINPREHRAAQALKRLRGRETGKAS